MSRNLREVVNDASFLPHRYDEMADAFRFLPVTRDIHRQCTFITDEHLPDIDSYSLHKRTDVANTRYDTAPMHFIFHSAYCCSTMMARAFDIQGVSMGLKEPVLLNDMIGWRRRGADQDKLNTVLGQSLDLLSRPFGEDKAVVVKASNICTPLAIPALQLKPETNALLLYAPIESFLKSIAKKEMWGRIWVRDVILGTRQDGYLIDGFEENDLLRLTDLQIAAIGWLSQHAAFGKIIETIGGDRVKTLDSDTFLARSPETISALTKHFRLTMDDETMSSVLSGPAFNSHSKLDQNRDGETFDAKARKDEQDQMALVHGAEIDMVAKWTKAVAESQGLSMNLSSHLLG